MLYVIMYNLYLIVIQCNVLRDHTYQFPYGEGLVELGTKNM
jgi:hypothetical protein